MISTLKKAEPTQADIIEAGGICVGHEYSFEMLRNSGRTIEEVLMCRERQLELALALLTDEQRERIGA